MFLLLRIRDTVEIEPAYFSPEKIHSLSAPALPLTSSDASSAGTDVKYISTHEDVLWHRVSERYVGRVIPCRGLCVAVGELVGFSSSTIRGSDGSSWTTVTFDAVIFRPEVGDRLRAVIQRQTEKGVYLSLELFHDVFVPAAHLVQPSIFDDAAGTWHLRLEDEETGEVTLNAYRRGDEVLVAVRDVIVRSSITDMTVAETSLYGQDEDAPMSIIGTFLDVGLGPCVWYE